MTNNTYVGKDFPDQIVAQECGHVVALAAAGLTDEFISVTTVIQATTSGELVTICTDDGYTHIYRWDGVFMRRFH